MNRKGFTLVELLGVLVIVAILSIVVVTPILGQIRNNSKKLDDASLKILYSATSSYLDNNKNLYPKLNKQVYYVSIGQLIDSGTLESNYLSSYSEKTLSRKDVIKITVENDGYQYAFAKDGDNLSVLSDVISTINNDSTYSFLGGKYFSGSPTNNYVYYSGITWRIMGTNKDGSIKLVSDEPITALNYGNTKVYNENYVNDWLTNYYFSRINFSDFIVKERFCSVTTSSTSDASDACNNVTATDDDYKYVGLLTLYEYNLSVLNGNTYLKNNLPFSTMTYVGDSTVNLYSIDGTGTVSKKTSNAIQYVRPTISLMPESVITKGNGTSANPYILFQNVQKVTQADNITLSSLNLAAGEYVNVDSKTYRVIESDSSSVKMIQNSLYNQSGTDINMAFGSTSKFDVDEGLAHYLSNDVYQNSYNLNGIVKSNFWYQGGNTNTSDNYKVTSLSKTNILYGVTVGLPKLGEILTAPIYGTTTNDFWTMTKYDDSTLNVVSNSGIVTTASTSTSYIRPVVIFDANTQVVDGNGTKASPYVVTY